MPEQSPVVAAERAYLTVRSQILNGELSGGQLVSEVKVGADLGISRTPVHEAFLRLGAEQLLDLIPRKGAIVRPLTPSEASDVLSMRRGVEIGAAEQLLAKRRPDDAVAERLLANLARQREYVNSGDVDAFVEADDEFHATMVAASGNPIACHFYEQLRGRQQRLRNLLLQIDPANLGSSFDDHEQLAACFLDRDAVEFARLLTAHLDRYQGAI